ncbi:MAG: peptidoglycan synthetase, partial [Chitinophagia bacterium]|nr:peptidoglycan synthetase [Chitinophagia bacterium]
MKRIHFIAIGGAIMHQLALALQRQGYQVTGSDDEINDPARTNLKAAGLLPAEHGWFPDKIDSNIEGIVLGMHAKADNPELLQAQRLNIPIYSFPEYIYEVCKQKQRVVIAGSHGKTTITSMVMHILKENGKVFDYLVGAKVPGFDSSVQLSDAPLIIVEGDEYPASVIEKRPKIFFYHPQITLLSGIAWDHINVFPTYDNYFGQFRHYLSILEAQVPVVYNAGDAEVVRAVNEQQGRLTAIPYTTPTYRYEQGKPLVAVNGAEITLNVFGRHNLQNALGAVTVCQQLGIDEATAWQALASFTGAARRLEKVLENDRIS